MTRLAGASGCAVLCDGGDASARAQRGIPTMRRRMPLAITKAPLCSHGGWLEPRNAAVAAVARSSMLGPGPAACARLAHPGCLAFKSVPCKRQLLKSVGGSARVAVHGRVGPAFDAPGAAPSPRQVHAIPFLVEISDHGRFQPGFRRHRFAEQLHPSGLVGQQGEAAPVPVQFTAGSCAAGCDAPNRPRPAPTAAELTARRGAQTHLCLGGKQARHACKTNRRARGSGRRSALRLARYRTARATQPHAQRESTLHPGTPHRAPSRAAISAARVLPERGARQDVARIR